MNEQFHITSQEWKYSSRQRAMLQVVHLAELPVPIDGESIFITDTPPSGTNNRFTTQQSFDVPDMTPYANVQWDGTTGYMPASYGGWSFVTPILDGWQDWSLILTSAPVGLTTHQIGYAAPARLNGGLCLTQLHTNLQVPGFVGFYPPIGIQALAFASHPELGVYPPSDYQQLMRVSSALYGKGSKWFTPLPGYLLDAVYPDSDSLFLVDNITTGTSMSDSRYLGATVLPESSINPNYGILIEDFNALWFGPRNP